MIKTATLRRKSRFQVKGSRYGTRNVWCPGYSSCLDRCFTKNLPGFTCQGCKHEHDQSAGPKDSAELVEDAICCTALIYAALGKVKRETAFKAVGVTVKRGGMG
jgi:hypothetical protein